MLYYNLETLFKARNITEKVKFLMNNDISSNLAHRIVSGEYDKVSLEVMEKLCRAFNCTPNDIYRFTPNSEADKSELNALNKIAHAENAYTNTNVLYSLPLDKLNELAAIINAKK